MAAPDDDGATPPHGAARGAAAHFFDRDQDGRLDLLLLDGAGVPPFDRGPYHLLANESPRRHFASVALAGRSSNREGLGAWVDLEACGRRRRVFHTGGVGPTSQSAVPLHFGLGDCATVEGITVEWPSGIRQVVRDVQVDGTTRIEEPLPDILLIVIDTERAASMSLHGYDRETTPELEKFARDAVTYERATLPAPGPFLRTHRF